MLKRLFRTDSGDTAGLVLRVLLGAVFIPHGAQKVFGWWGGPGYSGAIAMFGKMGIPVFFAFLDIVAESLGALALIAGFLTRLAAFGIFVVMVVAVAMIHFQNGFFMNWFGQKKGEGFEYHILACAIAIALMIKGGGRWSVDAMIGRKG